MVVKNYQMTYSLGCNFDPNLIKIIKKEDKEGTIKSVFGKLRKDIVGGGRSSMILPQLSNKELEDYIDLCHKNNLKFNYLLNPMCMGNRELNKSFHKQILKYLDFLSNIGVDSITVNSPYLCELLKKQYPHFKVTIGLYAYIFNLQNVKQWENLGADELTLHHLVNRNFPLLEDMLNYTKNSTVALRLIANNVCLHDCPYQINHGTGQAHASQKGNSSSNLYIDYNLLSCNYQKIKDPSKLIAAEWIRPEDIVLYEDLAIKTGNSNFSIKLLERTKTTEFLERVIIAYINRSFDGNLIDILTWPTKKNTKIIHTFPMYLNALTGRYNISELKRFENTFNLPEIYIDNKKLNGFLDKFTKSYDCNSKVCSDGNLNSGNTTPYSCVYCRNWADKAVSYDNDNIQKWLNECDSVFDGLKTSKMFK